MSPPSLECHPHHCPIQASELAETRNEKAAFLSLAPLPITLKKGILLEKTPGDLSVWKGKGHSEQRPRDSHLFGQQSPPSHPNPHLLSWRQLLCLWLPSAPTEEADAVCHPGLFTIRWPFSKCRSMFQVYLPSCMFVIVSWVSFMVKPEVVPGRWTSHPKLVFHSFVSPGLSITNQCVSITTIPSAKGEIYKTNALQCLQS